MSIVRARKAVPMRFINFRIDTALSNALRQHCEEQKLKPSQVMRQALKKYLLDKAPATKNL